MEKITSPGNSKIKLAASLHLKKNRETLGLFAAEGVRLCEMAAASGWGKEFAIVTEAAVGTERTAALIKILEGKGCPVYVTTEPIYKKASATQTPQGILLVMKKQSGRLEDLPKNSAFLAILDGVQDAGNAGSIIRTADAVGCDAVISLAGSVDVFSDKTIRAAMGSVFHLPVIEGVASVDILNYCRENGIEIFSAALDKEAESCFDFQCRKKNAFVFGNEGNGVSKELLDNTRHVYIPMAGGTESLNVGAAAAVVLYEIFRRSGAYSQKI